MTRVVISQPMFLPWIGLFDQVRLADVFVHYDDVQRPQGRSFVNRVQIPSAAGPVWLTAPIDRERSASAIFRTFLVSGTGWRETHLETLRHVYARQANFEQMFALAREIYSCPSDNLAEFNIAAIECIASRLGLSPQFVRSSGVDIEGASTARLVRISKHFGATEYITGHGALNYLNHETFDQSGIDVRYMRYASRPWPQLGSSFTPYVTILDLLAAVQFDEARSFLRSDTRSWQNFRESDRGVMLEAFSPP